MLLSPLILLLLTGALAATAYVLSLAIGARRQRALQLAANQHDWHYTSTDRFGLAARLQSKPPTVSPADMTVSHIAHRQIVAESAVLQFVACVEFTTGAARRPHRRRMLAVVTESAAIGEWTVQYHLCTSVLNDYPRLIAECGPAGATRPTNEVI